LTDAKDEQRHFVPEKGLGSILDTPTFAIQFVKMAEKDMKKEAKNNPENSPEFDINTDDSVTGTTHLNEPVEDESESEKLRAELDDAKDKFVRKVAEFENFKKRSAKERIDLIQTAGREVIVDLLDVLDDCDRAQKQLGSPETSDSIKEGVLLVFNKLRNTLQARGVKAMDTIGQEFNPDLHEAITEIPAPTEQLKGKIVDEVMKGYYLNDKIIRHAKVIVGK